MTNRYITTYPWQKSDWSKLVNQKIKGRLAHAYLVCGIAGIGKFDFVFKFSKYLLCASPDKYDACGKCADCKLFDSIHPNIKVLMPENIASEIKVDQVRDLTDFINKTGHSGGLKLCIIGNADRLNANATNALLKTLEEPSGESTLFLCSSFPGLLSPTLRSRCQKFSMKEPGRKETLDWIKEQANEAIDDNLLSSVTENGPLEIKELVESRKLEKQNFFIENFINLLTEQRSTQDVVNSAMELGGRDSVTCLMQFLSRAMVMYFSNQVVDSNSPEKFFADILDKSSLSPRNLAILLFRYYDQVAQAYVDLSGSSNVSPQLTMESLIWRGSQLDLC